jgi:phosphotriesterase-related protein
VKLNTAAGQVATNALGKTLMHEHLVIGFAGWEGDTFCKGAERRDLIAACVDRIEELKSAGYASLLDPCPNDLGRDIEVMAEVAVKTGFNVLFTTGLYDEHFAGAYWKARVAADRNSAKYIADMYIQELTEGVGTTGLKPAAIKVANGPAPFPNYEIQVMTAAAAASNATGAPIITHTAGVDGEKQLDFLKSQGVPAEKVIVGHSCGCADHDYHRLICEGGAYIGFDRFGAERIQPDEVRIQSMIKLIEAGFARQVVVSHDCVFHLRGQMGTPAGHAAVQSRKPVHFARVIAPRLKALGVSQELLDSIVRDNPKRYFEGETRFSARQEATGADAA